MIEAEARPPSVLFVVIDTLRADRVGAYGHHRDTTPALDELAAEGVRFADATIPASWTWPGHASLFTGQPPWVHGAHHADQTVADDGSEVGVSGKAKAVEGIQPGMRTFAGYFRDAGYETVAVASNNLLEPRFGLVRGFEKVLASVPDPTVVERASDVLAEERDEPLLLFVNLMSAHAPYAASPAPWLDDTERSFWDADKAPGWLQPFIVERDGQPVLAFTKASGFGHEHPMQDGSVYEIPPMGVEFIGEVYDGGVNMADAHLNVLVRRFRAAHPDGIVVVTSDHGEYLGEHGLLNHHSTVYRPVTWVPLVVSWPGHLDPSVVEEPVPAEQIAGTVLSLAGISAPLPSLLDGHMGPIQAQSWVDHHRAGRFGGIFEHGWKLYREGSRALVLGDDGTRELYELSTDPLMLAPIDGDIAGIEALAATAFPSSTGGDVDASVNQALQALGYIDDDGPPE